MGPAIVDTQNIIYIIINTMTNNDMEIEYITRKELTDKVNEFMTKAKLKDKKWVYNYFTGHDEWPIVTDEVRKKVKEVDHWAPRPEEAV